jgi:DNA (cytosine-5)-methyltransferase 1
LAVQTIDLFCGCGGLTAGFRAAGFENLVGFDNWQAALDTYSANNPDQGEMLDLGDLSASLERLAEYKGIDGVIGGPPCQDFSSAGKRTEGDRADLTEKYAAIVKELEPTFFLMENVPRADKSRAYEKAIKVLEKAGYGISKRVIDASRVGVPQSRKRLITIGWKNANKQDEIGELLDAGLSDHRTTMRDYFGDALGTEYIYRHPRSYARRAIFSIDEPCPTVRGVNRPIAPGYPGHHGDKADASKARPLTTEERARVQTFENWTWPKSKTDAEQIIGNAVPVLLANYVARQIAAYQAALPSSDE